MNDEMMYLLIPFISDWRIEAGSGHVANESSRQSEDSTVGIFMMGCPTVSCVHICEKPLFQRAGCCSTEFLVLRAEKQNPDGSRMAFNLM
jgi:hypothetical protein